MRIDLNQTTDYSYQIHYLDSISQVCQRIIEETNATSFAVVMGENVYALYGEQCMASIRKAETPAECIVIPSGEEYKTLETAKQLLYEVQKHEMDRKSVLISFGGGVTGDITGFAASIAYRGIQYIQVPTTLLACVDASVGGKTGVNSPYGKNLIGTFHQPLGVYICPEFFNTLDDLEWRSGLAEVVKYAVCFDASFFTYLEQNTDNILHKKPACVREIIMKSVAHKKRIVEEDEKEQGVRMLLNFGHTLGHAIEKKHKFSGYTHGEAISIGMVYAMSLSEEHTGLDHSATERLIALLHTFGLPTSAQLPVSDYLEQVTYDKKKQGDVLNWILLEDIGKAVMQKLPV